MRATKDIAKEYREEWEKRRDKQNKSIWAFHVLFISFLLLIFYG